MKNTMNYLQMPHPMSIDLGKIDVDRVKKKLYNNNMNFKSVTYDGYYTTIITDNDPSKVFDLFSSKFSCCNYDIIKGNSYYNYFRKKRIYI